MGLLSEVEMRALLGLLDDPDPSVYDIIKEKILSLGTDAIPSLEQEWDQHFDNTVQRRIEDLIHEIQFEVVLRKFKSWAFRGATDLLEGTFIVAEYQYPDFNFSVLTSTIDRIIQDVKGEINANLSPLEKVKVINHILYDIHKFKGNKQNYHAPQNSYITDVIQARMGNPLTLSVLYLEVAKSLDIPIFGVNLPEHFIMAYLDEKHIAEHGKRAPILFYVNAFNRGAIFRRSEVELFIRQMDIEVSESYFQPCSNEEILLRMLHNLSLAYEKLGYPKKKAEIDILKDVLKNFTA